ncbi:MAG TPA: amino acid permease [Gemmatimonadaceae bacterium]|nr:amino acid permease [Gemmatimonadaceae bacterium]
MTAGSAARAAAEVPADFVKAMTLTDATMLAAGSMIGSGIFIVSADIARILGSPLLLLAVWTLTGIMTLLGALAYGEMAAMYPHAGGQYVFLREAMGPLPGFLYGWTLFLIIQTGTIAAVAVAFARFLGVLWPASAPELFAWFPHVDFATPGGAITLGLSPQRLIALAMVWTLTAVNLRGVREGKLVQTSLTFVKTAVLVALVVLGLAVGRNAGAVAANFGAGRFAGPIDWSGAFVIAFGSAMVGALFSTDAWNNVTFAAAEVRDASRNLPRALLYGTLLVTGLYVLVNLAYLSLLPLHGAAGGADVAARGIQWATQDRVGTAAAEVLFGAAGVTVMAAAILVSTFGCNNGLILSGARVYYAMAKDGLFFRRVGALSARKVPAAALVAQAAWTSVLCLTGTYSQLLDYVIFAALLFYALTTAGLFLLRRKAPDVARPYRAVGYPALPALYLALAATVCVILLLADKTRTQALGGLVLVLVGIPVFYLWRGRAAMAAA